MPTYQSSVIVAIQDLGGINPDRIKACGTWTEWAELPVNLKLRIFRKDSTNSPDDVASQLEAFNVFSESELLTLLKDPVKVNLDPDRINEWDMLMAELEQARRELDQYRKAYEIRFFKFGKNFVPYHVPVTDVPF